jgi:glycosyltransferase involved in cell wall biosynthesis
MKILFITNGFTESVFPLAGSLSNENQTHILFLSNPNFLYREYGFSYKGKYLKFLGSDFLGLRPFLKDRSRVLNEAQISFYLMSRKMFSRRYFYNDLKFYIALYFYIRRLKPDVVNIVGHSDFFFEITKLIPRNVKSVFTLHEVTIDRITNGATSNRFLRYLYNSDNSIIFHSEYLRKVFLNVSGNLPKRNTVLPLGLFNHYLYLQTLPLSELNIASGKFVVLNYGYLRAYKGYEVFLDVAKRLIHNRDIVFVLAGEGTLPADFYPLPKNVIFINRYLKGGEIAYLHRESSVTLLPYLAASQSGVVMSSFAFNKPVIVTDVGAFSEYVQSGINGFIVEPGNAEQIVQNISFLYSCFANGKSTFGSQIDGTNFMKTWDNLKDLYLEFLHSLD